MKEKIIILGAGVMQGPVIKIAKELGFYAIVLDGSSQAPCIAAADQFEQIDLKNKEEIETFARSLQKEGGRLGIMTAGTDFSASVAWTAEKLGLPGIPYEAALNASDKSRMRGCFKKAGLPSPDFISITKESDLNSIPLAFPLVVKPVDNMGSRGCRRADNISQLRDAVKTAIGFSRSGRAIAENYMEGPEYSVDAIVYHGEITICGLADRHIFFPPYFIEMGHTMPSIAENENKEAMLDTFCGGIRALGLAGEKSIGAAKGDIKMTANGPMIGEIAARLSGGYMSGWTYPYSSGAFPVKGAILAAMGRPPEGLVPLKTWTCAERAFISIPGTVKALYNTDETQKEIFINNIFFRIEEGSKVSFPENNVTKCGNVIASAQERENAINAAETAARSILIRLDPSDKETEKFLLNNACNNPTAPQFENNKFPPDAFTLSNELKKALNQIPESKISDPHLSAANCRLISFPAFETSGICDYMGRTVKEALNAVRQITGLPLSETVGDQKENAENIMLGRSFWAALIRGSYQGAVFYIDNLGAK
ncbi:MAG: ATP-grasp domain-containing protein [Treponema sp.]|nr:ATP-grasp domain-containing protein [Treponema sp.]